MLVLVPLEMNVLVEFRTAAVAFRDEVKADATYVFLGPEILEVVHFFALYFKFQQAEVLQAHFVAFAQMATDD